MPLLLTGSEHRSQFFTSIRWDNWRTIAMTNGNGNGGVTKPIIETVRALSGTPMLLVLLVMNLTILGMITYLLKVRGEHIKEERQEIMELLRHCLDEDNDKRP